MAKPSGFIDQIDFSRGVISDIAGHQLPANAVLSSVDYMLDRQGIAYKRGGWVAASTLVASRTSKLVAYSNDFTVPNKLVWVSDNNHLYNVSGTDKGAFGATTIYDTCYRVGGGKFLMIFSGSGVPYKFDGTTLAVLGGSPPSGRLYCAVYKTRVAVGGHLTTDPQRIYWSPTPDIEAAWDTTNSWIDADHPVKGFCALQGIFLIFTDRQVERLVGSTPPPGTDFDHGVVANLSCIDSRSIKPWNGNAIFANSNGIYMTNGFGFKDITAISGRKKEWMDLLHDYTATNVACGIIKNLLFVSLTGASGLEVACWVFNLNSSTLPSWNVKNLGATHFARVTGQYLQEELLVATNKLGYVLQMSDMFRPSASNKNDDDGEAVAPTMTFSPKGASLSLTHFEDGWLDYDMRDAASDNPTMAISTSPGFEPSSYTAVPESPLAENTDEGPTRFTVALQSKAATVKITQTNASSKTEIYGVRLSANQIFPKRISGQQ